MPLDALITALLLGLVFATKWIQNLLLRTSRAYGAMSRMLRAGVSPEAERIADEEIEWIKTRKRFWQ